MYYNNMSNQSYLEIHKDIRLKTLNYHTCNTRKCVNSYILALCMLIYKDNITINHSKSNNLTIESVYIIDRVDLYYERYYLTEPFNVSI